MLHFHSVTTLTVTFLSLLLDQNKDSNQRSYSCQCQCIRKKDKSCFARSAVLDNYENSPVNSSQARYDPGSGEGLVHDFMAEYLVVCFP